MIKRKISICTIAFLVMICMTVPTLGAAKKGSAYKVVDHGGYVYCTHKKGADATIFRVDKDSENKTVYYEDNRAFDIVRMTVSGNYLYFQKYYGQDLTRKDGIFRINLKNGKMKKLDTGYNYIISKGKIYYQKYSFKRIGKWKNRVMNLDGSKKKKSRYSVKAKTKESKVRGYKLKSKSFDGGFEHKNWLVCPSGNEIYLGASVG